MPTQGYIQDLERARQAAADLAISEARQRTLAEHLADPQLLARADAADAEIAPLSRAAAKAADAFSELERQMQDATIAGNEKELSRLEGLFGARKRLKEHAESVRDETLSRHEMLLVAARTFRARQQCAADFGALDGRGAAVDEAVACLTAAISVFRDSLGDCVMSLADAIRERNVAAADFDRRAESCGYGKRSGQVELKRVLEDVVTVLRDRDYQYSGQNLSLAVHLTTNGPTLMFSFSQRTAVRL